MANQTGTSSTLIECSSVVQQQSSHHSRTASSTLTSSHTAHQPLATLPSTTNESNIPRSVAAGLPEWSFIVNTPQRMPSKTQYSTFTLSTYAPRQIAQRTVPRSRKERTQRRILSSECTSTVSQSSQRSHFDQSKSKREKLNQINSVLLCKANERLLQTNKPCLVDESKLSKTRCRGGSYIWNTPPGLRYPYVHQRKRNASDFYTVFPTDPPDNSPWHEKHRRK